ncbi:hypothetical protein HDV03_005563 [Kappamyces sp. JEL0829]|nr:hypothetical protein HDV03_005563 [Kappamyces sp. JEL0829]
MTIRNIIFDLGGVFIDIDYSATSRKFAELGFGHFDDFFSQSHSGALFEALETGKIAEADFYQQIQSEIALQTEQAGTASRDAPTTAAIRDAWNAMLLAWRLECLVWLEGIKSKYNVYLYSNTNIIHFKCFMDSLDTAKRQDRRLEHFVFGDQFIKTFYSHECGHRKPYAASFRKILHDERLQPDETLFIDDSERNLQGAQEAGLQVLYLKPGMLVSKLGL